MATRQLFVIDPRIENYQSLIACLIPESEWVLLDPELDGLAQLQAIAAKYQGLDSIQILSHGEPGVLMLGATNVSSGNIQNYAKALGVIGESLGPEGDILLYGCNVGLGEIGQSFIMQLAQLTGADVAASTDLTGSAAFGGNWILERSSGHIEASPIQDAGAYLAVLGVVDGTGSDNVLTGSPSADTLTGFAGADTLRGNGGDDLIDGGLGEDVAVYAKVIGSYSIAAGSAAGYLQVTGAESGDTLVGVETLSFADGTARVAFDGPGPSAFQVNSDTDDDQFSPSVTALANGGWIVVWQSLGQDGIYAQRFDATGLACGKEFQVSTSKIYSDGPSQPVVSALTDGGWVIAWRGAENILGQRYGEDGAPGGTEFRINTYTTDEQFSPSVTALSDGGWIVTWESNHQDGSSSGIFAQRYNASGTVFGPEFRINTTTSESQSHPAITALANGGWVVTWDSHTQDGSGGGIYAQHYGANGSVIQSEFRINTYTSGSQGSSSLAGLSDGGWIVAWTSDAQDGSGGGIYAQRYGAAGQTIESEIRVNSFTTGNQCAPSVAALNDGGWLVTWVSSSPDNTHNGIYAQRYGQQGLPNGAEFRVSGDTDHAYIAAVEGLLDGGWIVAWCDLDTSGSGIYSQRYNADSEPVGRLTLDVTGDASSQLLPGTDFADMLRGMAGNDMLVGGAGADTLIGGAGNDVFRFSSGSDSSYAAYDTVTDWQDGEQLEFDGLANVTWFAGTYIYSGSVAGTIQSIQNNPNVANNVVFFTDGMDGYLYIKGGDTGVNFDSTMVRLSGTTKPPPVLGLNTAPEANHATASCDEDTSISGTVTASDIEGARLTFRAVAQPNHGTLLLDPNGGYTYTPATNFSGTDNFTFTANDGSFDSTVAKISITVKPVNDAPTGSVTITGNATQGQSLTASNNLADADGLGAINYQWKADGADIAGATASTFVLTATQVGKIITATARYTDAFGTPESQTSSGTAPVAAADTTPPAVSSINPVNEATDVAVDTNVVLTFTESIQLGTGAITLKTADGTVMATYDAATSSNLTVSGPALTIDPSEDLAYGTGYAVEFAAGAIKDLAGNSFDATATYHFKTVIHIVTGTDSADSLSGLSGVDSISGLGGNDTIDGGQGIDTSQYAGGRDQFQLTKAAAASWTVNDTLGIEGTDQLHDIERLHFSDKKIALDLSPGEHAGQALEFIGVLAPALVSAPSIVGSVLGLLDQGSDLQGVFQFAIDTGLVSNLAGSNSNADIAKMAYRNVTDAEADAEMTDLLVSFMDGRNAEYSQAEFLTVIAGMEINQTHINLLGLQQTGIEYS